MDELSISSLNDADTPLTTEPTPTPMMISPATTTITCPPGHASTPEVVCCWDCELDDREPRETEAALAPSAT